MLRFFAYFHTKIQILIRELYINAFLIGVVSCSNNPQQYVVGKLTGSNGNEL